MTGSPRPRSVTARPCKKAIRQGSYSSGAAPASTQTRRRRVGRRANARSQSTTTPRVARNHDAEARERAGPGAGHGHPPPEQPQPEGDAQHRRDREPDLQALRPGWAASRRTPGRRRPPAPTPRAKRRCNARRSAPHQRAVNVLGEQGRGRDHVGRAGRHHRREHRGDEEAEQPRRDRREQGPRPGRRRSGRGSSPKGPSPRLEYQARAASAVRPSRRAEPLHEVAHHEADPPVHLGLARRAGAHHERLGHDPHQAPGARSSR